MKKPQKKEDLSKLRDGRIKAAKFITVRGDTFFLEIIATPEDWIKLDKYYDDQIYQDHFDIKFIRPALKEIKDVKKRGIHKNQAEIVEKIKYYSALLYPIILDYCKQPEESWSDNLKEYFHCMDSDLKNSYIRNKRGVYKYSPSALMAYIIQCYFLDEIEANELKKPFDDIDSFKSTYIYNKDVIKTRNQLLKKMTIEMRTRIFNNFILPQYIKTIKIMDLTSKE